MRKQIALCIGNDDYKFSCLSKLKCSVNDSIAVADKLRTLNYDVTCLQNQNREEMYSAVDDFELKLSDYDVAVFFYAGHGFECDGKNLLMPVDTDGIDQGYKEWKALQLDYVIQALEGAHHPNTLQTKIIILDACRQTGRTRGGERIGFAPVFAPEGTIIAFSTSPGQTALEFETHGAYTNALLQSIDLPRIPIENMFKHVREVLSATTGKRQISWEHTSLMGNYCFNEDRIEVFSFYSPEALSDNNYYFNSSNPFFSIINELKSQNWYKQNPAIDELSTISYKDVSANDLFVVGRNIYQAACGNAWSAVNFIQSFSENTIVLEAKKHVLCGMAYEIYYSKYNMLRASFKSEYYIDILRLLEREEFQMCKNFISDRLLKETNRIIYIPGSEKKIDLHLSCEVFDMIDGDTIFSIISVFHSGTNILFNSSGFSGFEQDDYMYSSAKHLSSLRIELARGLVAPPDMLIITSDVEDSSNHYFKLPSQYIFQNRETDY